MPKVVICIPTYKRTHLLKLLVQDLLHQTLMPSQLIIVDGNPSSGEVKQGLRELQIALPIFYIPSNHANLPYQRYLGWRVATQLEADDLVYFDDDQRIIQPNLLEWLVKPLDAEGKVVGVGCLSRVPTENTLAQIEYVAKRGKHWLVKLFGSSAISNYAPGQLTPTGHRIELIDRGEDYVDTEWLQGRVMAYRMSAISSDTFSSDLFATYECRIGRAEDTFLSRRVGAKGKMLFTYRAVVEHPNADSPKAYEHEPFKFAYAATYSRRFLNEHFRVYESPSMSDRSALLKSYIGNVFLAWLRVLRKPSQLNYALARGTTLGAVHGLSRVPTAENLTPDINWWADAEISIANKEAVYRGSE